MNVQIFPQRSHFVRFEGSLKVKRFRTNKQEISQSILLTEGRSARTHTHSHTRSHACMHTYTHIHTLTHTGMRPMVTRPPSKEQFVLGELISGWFDWSINTILNLSLTLVFSFTLKWLFNWLINLIPSEEPTDD